MVKPTKYLSSVSIGCVLCAAGICVIAAANAQSVDLSDRFSTRFESTEKQKRTKLGPVKLRGRVEVNFGENDNVFRQEEEKETERFTDVKAVVGASISEEKKALRITAYGQSRIHEEFGSADQNRALLIGYGRYDLEDRTRMEVISRYEIRTLAREDEREERNMRFAPTDEIFGADFFLTRSFGDAALTLRGGAQRSQFENVARNNLDLIIRDDQDRIVYDTRGRASYNLTKGLSAFAEIGLSKWDFDTNIDRNGIARGSDGIHPIIGAYFQPSKSLKGEFAIGGRQQSFADVRYKTIVTPTFDAWVQWDPTADLRFTSWAETEFEEETVRNRAGTISRSAAVQAQYYFSEKWRGVTKWRYRLDDNISNDLNDKLWAAELGLDYEIRPGILTSLQYGRRDYSDGDDRNSYTADEVLVSFTLQK